MNVRLFNEIVITAIKYIVMAQSGLVIYLIDATLLINAAASRRRLCTERAQYIAQNHRKQRYRGSCTPCKTFYFLEALNWACGYLRIGTVFLL